jgi:CBS domain-containing protein
LLRLMAQGRAGREAKVTVAEIMNREPVTVSPETPTTAAIRLMREKKLACLPVTQQDRLVGIVTEHDLIIVASRLLETYLDTSA